MRSCEFLHPDLAESCTRPRVSQAILAAPLRSSTSLVVVDDGLRGETLQALAAFDNQITIVERKENAGFARACSLVHRARGR